MNLLYISNIQLTNIKSLLIKFSVTGQEAKSQWKKLRDSHREAMRRRKTSTGQATQNLKPWKYETLMEFLLSQTENSETSFNYSIYLEETSYNTQKISDQNTNNYVIESHPPPSESPLSTLSTIKSEKNSNQLDISEIVQRREKNREQRRTEREELRRDIIDSNRPQDALSALFASLCQKTRDLPKYLQLRVEREIFETINRAEEEALSYDSMNDLKNEYNSY